MSDYTPVAKSSLGITEVVLRDAHQSLFATRMRIDDMLPIAAQLDQIGYWSMESWGGATFDACIRFLGEDPWDRIREIKKVMPNTPQQMLFRGQNILGYRHYADDVVSKFVDRAAVNGIDVFRVFDAMNDMRNLKTALRAVKQVGKHAQGTIAYTVSPVHTLDLWVDQARQIEDAGADSICIKDMAGLLTPYVGFDLVTRLKRALAIPIQLHAHATTGLSTATIVKCVEAGIDNVDTAISSMAMTYGHSATESVVSIFKGRERDTGLDIVKLESIAAYFREVRKKYHHFEGSLRGVDSRILVAQVPGGMLTNMEGQLKEQGASDQLDAVLEEIPRVREDLGYIPLVTPTSQIVGTQAVLNVLTGERYKSISKETAGILRGEYGAAPAPVNSQLQARVLAPGEQPVTCRPADLLAPELDILSAELRELAEQHQFVTQTGDREIDDILTYALFPQVALKFFRHSGDPNIFEAPPAVLAEVARQPFGEQVYTVEVEGQDYLVKVTESGEVNAIQPQASAAPDRSQSAATSPIVAPLAGTVVKVLVGAGQEVTEGQSVLTLEAMKMETSVSAARSGVVAEVAVSAGDAVSVGDLLMTLN
ncbi:MAG: sodium-extruding oxaloacetate decarboxylase subunit alpha [Porticoccaceae bacterium]|nr:sodium-extruding oxaloacetate decarboxylase subunit alpha [Porticoccaceae bacterium]